MFRVNNVYHELKWHYTHWLIIFTATPRMFPRTEDMTPSECACYHRDMFYEYLSWGIDNY